ncbi:MAG: hypothetical protein PHS44_01720 [Candidatus Dojkabacteria bacterium]|jgi:magnesium-transporting ATPase (P-type)|nr:hypothetical protein [Candidatus Dojkabacteria bacterium]
MEKANNFIENLKQVDLSEIDWGIIFDWNYLTDKSPENSFIFEQWLYVFVLIFMLTAVIGFKFISKLYKSEGPKYRFVRKVSFLWFANSVFMLLYTLIRSEGVSFLSMRLFLVIFLILYVIILIYIPVYIFLVLPKRMVAFRDAKLRDKYKNRKHN